MYLLAFRGSHLGSHLEKDTLDHKNNHKDGFVHLKNIEKEVLQLKFEQKLTEIWIYYIFGLRWRPSWKAGKPS